jgi:two-component system phosphate regulon sensor histidine kinase PhoR
MRWHLAPRQNETLVTWLMAAVCLSLAVLVWSGYGAVREWQRSQELLADRRARERVDLLVTALARDMRGVQETVLASGWEAESFAAPHEVRNLVASAFARYPYPESFFAWRDGTPDGSLLFFDRSDRRPEWMPPDAGQDRFPVSIRYEPAVASVILGRVRADVRLGRRFSTFETSLGRTRYQVVARLFYRDPFREQIDRVAGFTVNLSWVREHYFPEMARQVTRIGQGGPLAIVDDRGLPVGGVVATAGGPIVRQWFPVMFFDPLLVGIDSPADLSRQAWAVQAGLGGDADAAAATRGANRTLFMATVAVAALALGLVLTARAARHSARLAEMRSEFVSTVTHELKTPIATIRAVGDTLVRGRISEPQALREYAQLVVQEAKRLTRLVENLLAYARITDVTEVYAFEPLALEPLLNEALKGFAAQLSEAGFAVQVDVPPDLPPVRGDPTALRLVLDNLLDNAIRYSGAGRWLGLRASAAPSGRVVLEVGDRGVGIPASEIDKVTRRFYRGRRPRSSGSGLGLAIVKRIAEDHGGTVTISSTPGTGTTVRLEIPAMEKGREEADPDR